MLRKEFDGAQDMIFVFRCVEVVKDEEIYHVPKILYHWRCHEDSTAENRRARPMLLTQDEELCRSITTESA